MIKIKRTTITIADFAATSRANSAKRSISGAQVKLLANIEEGNLVAADNGEYIIKPNKTYANSAENEFVSMQIAKEMGLNIPKIGLVDLRDGTKCYIVKNFNHKHNRSIFDFCAVLNISSEYKYDGATFEDVGNRLNSKDRIYLFNQLLASYLIGNTDFHLKNISIFDSGRLTPSYDILSVELSDPGAVSEFGFEPELYSGISPSHKVSIAEFDELAKRIDVSSREKKSIYVSCFSGLKKSTEIIAKSQLSESDKNNYLKNILDHAGQFLSRRSDLSADLKRRIPDLKTSSVIEELVNARLNSKGRCSKCGRKAKALINGMGITCSRGGR